MTTKDGINYLSQEDIQKKYNLTDQETFNLRMNYLVDSGAYEYIEDPNNPKQKNHGYIEFDQDSFNKWAFNGTDQNGHLIDKNVLKYAPDYKEDLTMALPDDDRLREPWLKTYGILEASYKEPLYISEKTLGKYIVKSNHTKSVIDQPPKPQTHAKYEVSQEEFFDNLEKKRDEQIQKILEELKQSRKEQNKFQTNNKQRY